MINLPNKGKLLFSEYIKEARKYTNPNFKPIFAAASHITLTVRAPPPTSHQRDVWSLLTGPFGRLAHEKYFDQRLRRAVTDRLRQPQ